jgi:hypothetical protein
MKAYWIQGDNRRSEQARALLLASASGRPRRGGVMDQLVLPLGLITMHCFACPHTITAANGPGPAHEAMEHHYTTAHGALIRSIVTALT